MLINILIFLVTMSISALVNSQYRNAVKASYFHLFLTSCLIGSLNLFILKTIPKVDTLSQSLCYVVGGALGAMLGVFLHKKFHK